MSGLEGLRPFFRFCQWFGFLPYRMEINKETGRFEKFSFSWQNPITWWFIFFSIVNSVVHSSVATLVFKNPTVNSFPIAVRATTITVFVSFLLILLLARYSLIFRFPTLCKAIEFIRKTDQSFIINDQYLVCRCTLKQKTILGLVATFLWVFRLRLASYISKFIS